MGWFYPAILLLDPSISRGTPTNPYRSLSLNRPLLVVYFSAEGFEFSVQGLFFHAWLDESLISPVNHCPRDPAPVYSDDRWLMVDPFREQEPEFYVRHTVRPCTKPAFLPWFISLLNSSRGDSFQAYFWTHSWSGGLVGVIVRFVVDSKCFAAFFIHLWRDRLRRFRSVLSYGMERYIEELEARFDFSFAGE